MTAGTSHSVAPSADIDDAGGVGPAHEKWVRHPADLARFALAATVTIVVGLVVMLDPGSARRFSSAVIDAVDWLPGPVSSALVGITQLAAIVVPIVIIGVLIVGRRWRLLGVLALAAVLTAVVMALANGWIEESVPSETVKGKNVDSWLFGAAFPSSTYLGAIVGAVIAAGPWMPRSWRPFAWGGVAALAVSRLVTAVEVPVHITLVFVLGAAAGSLTLLITGAPRRRIDSNRLVAGLSEGGLAVSGLRRLDEQSTTPTFHGDLVRASDGNGAGAVYVKALGRDQRDANLLLRIWQVLTVKGLGDDVPAASARGFAEQEALALSFAAASEVRCPRPRALNTTSDGVTVMAADWVDGLALCELDEEHLDDRVLHDAWHQVALLHRHRIAHRSLAAHHLLVDSGDVSLVSFDRAQIAADDHALAADVAELLCATAALVGAERAVDAAADVMPRDALAIALPLLQPTVLTPPTRRAVKEHDDLLDHVREEAKRAAEVEDFELAKVKRVSLRGVVMLIGSAVLGYYLLSLVANWSEIWSTLQEADWARLPLLIALMICTYLGGAVSLMGAVRTDLPFVRTTQVMFAQSFLNRFTPANAGGMALRARYLQLQGEDLTVAAGSIGLTSAVSGFFQVLFLLVFVLWAGSTDELGKVQLPGIGIFLLVVVGIAAIVGFFVLSSWARRVVWPWAQRTFGTIFESLRELAQMPRKMVLLFGGSAAAKIAIVWAFYVSVQAMGVSMSFAEAGSVYMVGATIGSAVPTPGGVGGIEAVLTAALISTGVDNATAVSIVLLFRLVTFWLPTIPGWFFLQYVERKEIV